MKDISTPVPPDEFQAEMRQCLKKAALVNYTKVSKFVKIEGKLGDFISRRLFHFHSVLFSSLLFWCKH